MNEHDEAREQDAVDALKRRPKPLDPAITREQSLARIKAMDTAELKKEFAGLFILNALQWQHLADIWGELESRGEDMTEFDRGRLKQYLPFIAAGSLMPELVVQFVGQPSILNVVKRLPAREQKRIVDGEPIPVAVRIESRYEERRIQVANLGKLMKQVFDDGAIRTVAEQIAWLDSKIAPAIVERRSKRVPLVVSLSLKAEEEASLKKYAAETGANFATIIRDALRAANKI